MPTKKKRIFLYVGVVIAVLVGVRFAAAFAWPAINDVKTGETPEYPDLRSQRFDQPHERVFAAALAAARTMEWEVTAQSKEQGEIRAVATTPVFRFKDDVTLSVSRDASGTKVDMRSHSRIGKGDLGANARRIREFQAELARQLR